ncbi:peptidoglycan-recognition protein SC2-like [Venturia canescens]|uniref:peptidoglycan-recognition protein SC2-like n=1 Tax=Venturia canescens TaxID=32260 RepID=UPI001C9C69FF|nr:peptidoglycan-recognition protein SC2-like [Venturia canescens]
MFGFKVALSMLLFVFSIEAVPPSIITRAQWGARSPRKAPEALKERPPPFVVVHHSATDGCTSQAVCEARVRSFQNYHMDTKHWDDIGYNFLVGEDGNVYEGRGWDVRGAHSKDYNGKSIGICVIGTFEEREPQPAAIKSTKDLIAYGVSLGEINSSYVLYGHRQTSSTLCPGTTFYESLKSWPHWSSN